MAVIFFSNIGFACRDVPMIEGAGNCVVFYEGYMDGADMELRNLTHIEEYLKIQREICNFSDQDIGIVSDFLVIGYSVKLQTSGEYSNFLSEVQKANYGLPSYCLTYLAVHRNASWTGYAKGGCTFDIESQSCSCVPCIGGPAEILWNDSVDSEQEIFNGTSTDNNFHPTQEKYPDNKSLPSSWWLYALVFGIVVIASAVVFLIMHGRQTQKHETQQNNG